MQAIPKTLKEEKVADKGPQNRGKGAWPSLEGPTATTGSIMSVLQLLSSRCAGSDCPKFLNPFPVHLPSLCSAAGDPIYACRLRGCSYPLIAAGPLLVLMATVMPPLPSKLACMN